MSDSGEKVRAQRDAQMARVESGRASALVDRFQVAVVGVTFCRDYPDNLYELEVALENLTINQGDESLAAVLRRNPQNEYDYNAIEVHVPALGDSGMIGHLPRPIAARLAPEMDSGVKFLAAVAAVRISEEHVRNPGADIMVWKA